MCNWTVSLSRRYGICTEQGLGACLREADGEAVRRFVEELAVRALLPNLEARLRALNFQVCAAALGRRSDVTVHGAERLPASLLACLGSAAR